MSIRASVWAWTTPTSTPAGKLVLLALADHADEVGHCWPSVARLVEMTGLGERTVRSTIGVLIADGLIRSDRGGGRHKVSSYDLGINLSPERVRELHLKSQAERVQMTVEKVQKTAQRVQTAPEKVRHLHPEPSLTTNEPPLNRQSLTPRRDDAFDDWWNFYPRKAGKDAARKAYASALKRGATDADLAHGLQRQRWPTETRFIPHPATWLNQGRWQDDPEAAAPSQPEPPRPWWLEDMIHERH